jgi:hypothetical protein
LFQAGFPPQEGSRPFVFDVCKAREVFPAEPQSTLPTANLIWGRRRPAHSCCKSDVRALFSGNNREAREVTLRFADKGVLSCREARVGTLVPGLELPRGLLRSGCASFVAVMKSANLRYGNDGSAFQRRAAVPVCPWPVRGASWIRDTTRQLNTHNLGSCEVHYPLCSAIKSVRRRINRLPTNE